MTESISLEDARRIALTAQGFGTPRPAMPGNSRLLREVHRLGVLQIDSVNVLTRAHYLPIFSRLGAYDHSWMKAVAWGPRRQRRLFEFWAHEASLLPIELHPLFRWRMARAERGEIGYHGLRRFARENRPVAQEILERISAEGPKSAAEFEDGGNAKGWWNWSQAKHALEWLFWSGQVTTATRRPSFARVYDLPERVLPRSVLDMPTPDAGTAQRALVELGARALGIATAAEIRDYYRLKPEEADRAISDLRDAGVLQPVSVDGWRQEALLHRDSTLPRRVKASALLAPFDPLIWHRDRTERLFGFRYRLEIYVPEDRRTHGYYVLPFLLDEALVARVDLKADRQAGTLVARQVTLEHGAPSRALDALSAELETMTTWLGLARFSMAQVRTAGTT